MTRLLLIALATSFGWLSIARGEISFGIEIQPRGRAVPEGEQAIVNVRVVSESRIDRIPQLLAEGGELEVQRGGTRQSSFVFGRNSRHDVTYTFGVRGKPGSYKIRASLADASGQNYESEKVTLLVRARTEQEKAIDPQLRLELSNTEVYEGEPIDAKVYLLVKKGSRYSHEPTNRPKIVGDGINVVFETDATEGPAIDGHPTAMFKARVVPLRPGDLSVIATFEPEVATPTSTRRLRARRYDLSTPLLNLKVKPLPTEGRPTDFSGAVGSFQITIGADPLALKTGEPIRLRLSLSGHGNFATLTAPKPTNRDGWQLYDPSPLELQRGENDSPSKLEFEQNIVPLVVHSEIPSFKLSVFDPKKEAYVNLITAPIPLDMTGNAIAANDNPAAGTGSSPTDSRPRPEAILDDILMATGTASPAWSNAAPALWHRPAFWWLQGLLVAGLIGAALFARILVAKRPRTDTPPSFRELLHDAESAPSTASDFYTAAHRCLESCSDSVGHDDASDAITQLEERYAFIQFAGNEEARSLTVSPEERKSILKALRALKA